LGGQPLIEFGSCSLHILHNGFHAGLNSVDQTWGIEELLSDVFAFFKKYPSRSEDFYKIQKSLDVDRKVFKRLVSNRWLSLGPVCYRVINNLECLRKYFVKTDHSASIKNSSMYRRIAAKLQEGDVMLARLHFISSIALLFEPFLTKLQTESTVIHLLLEELAQLLHLLLQRFIKSDLLTSVTDAQLVDVSLDCRPVDNCEFGSTTRGLLQKLKRDKNQKLALLQKDMLQFLKSCAQYLQQRLPLKNTFLHSVQCLKPSARCNAETNQMIGSLAASVPTCV